MFMVPVTHDITDTSRLKRVLDNLKKKTFSDRAWLINFYVARSDGLVNGLSESGIFCMVCESADSPSGLMMLPVSFFPRVLDQIRSSGEFSFDVSDLPAGVAEKFPGVSKVFGSCVYDNCGLVTGAVGISSEEITDIARDAVRNTAAIVTDTIFVKDDPVSCMKKYARAK